MREEEEGAQPQTEPTEGTAIARQSEGREVLVQRGPGGEPLVPCDSWEGG